MYPHSTKKQKNTMRVLSSSLLILGAALPLCFAGIAVTVTPVTANPNPFKVVVSKEEFSKAVKACYPENKDKYTPEMLDTRYKAFMAGLAKSKIESKKEAAMFLAQILYTSLGLVHKKEILCQTDIEKCREAYPAKGPGKDTKKDYYARGYIQLAHDYNYDKASKALFNDDRLVKDPEQVGEDEDIAWAVSFWYWDSEVRNKEGVKEGKYGATTNAINGPIECEKKSNPKAVEKRNSNYTEVLKAFGIEDAPDTTGC